MRGTSRCHLFDYMLEIESRLCGERNNSLPFHVMSNSIYVLHTCVYDGGYGGQAMNVGHARPLEVLGGHAIGVGPTIYLGGIRHYISALVYYKLSQPIRPSLWAPCLYTLYIYICIYDMLIAGEKTRELARRGRWQKWSSRVAPQVDGPFRKRTFREGPLDKRSLRETSSRGKKRPLSGRSLWETSSRRAYQGGCHDALWERLSGREPWLRGAKLSKRSRPREGVVAAIGTLQLPGGYESSKRPSAFSTEASVGASTSRSCHPFFERDYWERKPLQETRVLSERTVFLSRERESLGLLEATLFFNHLPSYFYPTLPWTTLPLKLSLFTFFFPLAWFFGYLTPISS